MSLLLMWWAADAELWAQCAELLCMAGLADIVYVLPHMGLHRLHSTLLQRARWLRQRLPILRVSKSSTVLRGRLVRALVSKLHGIRSSAAVDTYDGKVSLLGTQGHTATAKWLPSQGTGVW